MPYSRPTLSDLRTQVAQDVVNAVGVGTNLLRRAVLRILADAQAGLAHLHYGYLDWIARQAVPFTCTDEFLEGWAALKGVTRKPATAATGTVTFSGAPGVIIPTATAVVRSDGVAYVTGDAVAVGSGGTATVTVTASEPGAAGNADAGVTMTLSAAIAGVQSAGVTATALTGGADVETDDDLRTRMLAVYATTAMGGSASDYVTWALQVPGVTRAWCLRRGAGVGTVVVYVMLDDANADGGGFPVGTDGVAADDSRALPATGDQITVANHLYDLQPVTALVYVCAPIATPVAFTIKNVPVSARDAVTAALKRQFITDAEPGGTVKISRLWAAVDAVAGVDGFDIQSPADDITADTGHLLTVGAVTYV